ncbi:MAG: L,D-transpeptidase family protein [Gammaproteobacteria bacterium]
MNEAPQAIITVDLSRQHLQLVRDGKLLLEAPVSTAAKGAGELLGSECTPRGWHVIRACIGTGCAPNTVFVGRRPSGEIYSPALASGNPQRDWILTRILWLGGLEPGRNRGGQVDTLRRYIYIHGCPEETPIGVPGSHGCVRMRNDDVTTLFQQVRAGTRVLIRE